MTTAIALAAGTDTFTLTQVLEKVCARKGLAVRTGFDLGQSEPFAEYVLDRQLLKRLDAQSFKIFERSPGGHYWAVYLIDRNVSEGRQESVDVSWLFGFTGDRPDLRLLASVRFGVKPDGIKLSPMLYTPPGFGPDQESTFRLWKILAAERKPAPRIVEELAASDGSVIVTWEEIDLHGLRSMSALLGELIGNNETVRTLAHKEAIFDPDPWPHNSPPSGQKLYVTGAAQPRLIGIWRAQLASYRDRLVI